MEPQHWQDCSRARPGFNGIAISLSVTGLWLRAAPCKCTRPGPGVAASLSLSIRESPGPSSGANRDCRGSSRLVFKFVASVPPAISGQVLAWARPAVTDRYTRADAVTKVGCMCTQNCKIHGSCTVLHLDLGACIFKSSFIFCIPVGGGKRVLCQPT